LGGHAPADFIPKEAPVKARPHNSGPTRTMPFLPSAACKKVRLTACKPSLFVLASGDKMHRSSHDLICAVLPSISLRENKRVLRRQEVKPKKQQRRERGACDAAGV